MKILIDTNLLCRLAEQRHPHHATAESAVLSLLQDGHELCVVPQVFYEYWVVATRPASQNGLEMPTDVVDRAIDAWLEVFTLLRDERGIFSRWRDLVRQFDAKGKNAHDARLVAAMQRHGLTHLLTFNVADFQRYATIQTLDPQSLPTL
jgi:predicted nucleic acid-binding protein